MHRGHRGIRRLRGGDGDAARGARMCRPPHRQLHREHFEALVEQVAGRIESLGVGECAKLAKYLHNRVPGLVLAQKSLLPRLEALAEQWSMPAVSLGCICWYLVRELYKRPAHARRRALSCHLLGAYGALKTSSVRRAHRCSKPSRQCCTSAIAPRAPSRGSTRRYAPISMSTKA